MDALYEAIALVVIVSLVGFWEWRSAVLMAISIPITLALTFGFAHVLGIDLQQVSIATLIIALPSLHTGGEVVIRHGGREVTLDLRSPDPSEASFAAFYADCVH